MNEKIKNGTFLLLLSLLFFLLPFLLNEDPDIISTASAVAMFNFAALIFMAAGMATIRGKKTNQERIEELEKRVETLEER